MGSRLQVPGSTATSASHTRSQVPALATSARWRVSQPGDASELEADRLADRVMESSGPGSPLDAIAADPAGPRPASAQIHRACAQCDGRDEQDERDETPLQRSASAPASGAAPPVSPAVAASVESLPGSGQRLPEAARSYFAPRFGFDFASVRIHTDAGAMATARQLQARAFTVGQDIVFAPGQYNPQSRPGLRLLAHELAHVVQHAPAVSRAAIQRAPDDAATGEAPAADAAAPAADAPAPQGLIVDDAAEPAENQMRKSELLGALRPAVQQAVEASFTSPAARAQVTTFVEGSFASAEAQSAAEVERGLVQQAPEAAGARAAADYLPIVVARVQQAAGAASAAPASDAGASAPVARKASGSAAPQPLSAPAVRSQLGSGTPIAAGVRSRMESGFDTDFSGVRVHTDPAAAKLAERLEATAFTIGEHVAFGRGEYRPGTTDGDTLLAHELAHVVQQRGQGGQGVTSGASEHALERDADASAETVMGRLWSGVKRRWSGARTGPRLASGPRVQRQIVKYHFQQRDFDSCLYCICQSQTGMPERMPDVLPSREAQCSAGLEVDLTPGSCGGTVSERVSARRRLSVDPCPESHHLCQ